MLILLPSLTPPSKNARNNCDYEQSLNEKGYNIDTCSRSLVHKLILKLWSSQLTQEAQINGLHTATSRIENPVQVSSY